MIDNRSNSAATRQWLVPAARAAALVLCCAVAHAGAPPDYYADVDDSSAETLRASLHERIDDHTRIPYTAFTLDTWDVLELADQDQDEPGNITTLYLNKSAPKQGGGNSFYNREHTWPRSYGFPDNDDDDNVPFTDMHALFLADPDYNSARENRPYEDCPTSECQELATVENDGRGGGPGGYPGESNWTRPEFGDGAFEVWIRRRGDVARALMYMAVRYDGGVHATLGLAEPDLILTNDRALIESARTGVNESVAYMGLLDTLLQWHQADPVDAVETQHHEAVFEAQGNRNPFIDHPEFAACVFQDQCQKSIAAAGLSGLWFDPALDGEGFNVIVSPAGTTVFYYGYSANGERLWLVSELFTGEWFFNEPVDFSLLQGQGGTFATPAAPPDALSSWGSLTITISDCGNAVFVLSGNDGDKTAQAVKLAGIDGVVCQ